MNERLPRRDDLIDCEVLGFDARGLGIANHREHSVRMRGALPGSLVRARIRKRRKTRIDAVPLEVLRAAPGAVSPRCAHFGTCGGCSFQGLGYAAQLVELGQMLGPLVAPLGAERVDPVLGCARPWNYRNKMDFTFGNRRWIEEGEPENAPRDFALGLHVPGRFDKVLDVQGCDIAFEEANPILRDARALAQELELDAWDVREHRGLLRHLVLRRAFATGEIMAVLVTTEEAEERLRPLVEGLLERHPEISTFVQQVNAGLALVATGAERVLHGPGFIREEVAGLRFEVSAASFFQTNTTQAGELVRIVLERAHEYLGTGLSGRRILDLYCGTGLFTLALARAGAAVTGFEVVESAIADARRAAQNNGIETVDFVAGDLAETLTAYFTDTQVNPELVVIDPPRAGVHPKTLAALRQVAPHHILYVSCHPTSAVQDIEGLLEDGYRVDRVQPVDLFPHTPHLECVFSLSKVPVARDEPKG